MFLKNVFIISNVYVHDRALKLKNFKHNKDFMKFLSEVSSIDSILDYDNFKECILYYKKYAKYNNGTLEALNILGNSSLFYGHLDSFFWYANIKEKNKNIIMPYIEHGINFSETILHDIPWYKMQCYIYQGNYKKNSMLRLNGRYPIFCVGPYIHYAKGYYSDEDMKILKKKLGRVLLVFPFHCHETSIASYNVKDFVNEIMTKYAKGFDTVIVSAYWNDVNQKVYKLFSDAGAMIVSNGHRGDANFINRQKSLLLLADVTIGNDIGTHIGYSEYLKRPYILMDKFKANFTDKNYSYSSPDLKQYSKTYNEFLNFYTYGRAMNYDGMNKNNQYEWFWGGDKYIKTSEEMRFIIEISKEILNVSKGYRNRFLYGINSMLKKYQLSGQMAKYKLLLSAIK